MGELSIKISDEQIARLRERATRNGRSLEAELRSIIDLMVPAQDKSMTIEELGARARALGLEPSDEATRWIREDRDAR
ncbi:MAG: hypothetical protein WDN03_11510 [Rhizomicrobium sp.]